MNTTEFPEDQARAIVTDLVKRKAALFARFRRGIGKDDLVAEGVAAAFQDWHQYNPRKSAVSSFIYRCAATRLIDLHRAAQRRQPRDGKGRVVELPEDDELSLHDPKPAFEWADMVNFGDDMPLPDWLKATYKAAQAMCIGPRWTQGRRYHTGAQLIAIYLLYKKLKASFRWCAETLRTSTELRNVLGLKLDRMPSHVSVYRASRLLNLAPDGNEKRRPRRAKVVTEKKIIVTPFLTPILTHAA